MLSFQDVPRRLNSRDEKDLRAAASRVQRAERDLAQALGARDQLIADLQHSGVRVADIAEVLELTAAAVYAAIRRTDGAADAPPGA